MQLYDTNTTRYTYTRRLRLKPRLHQRNMLRWYKRGIKSQDVYDKIFIHETRTLCRVYTSATCCGQQATCCAQLVASSNMLRATSNLLRATSNMLPATSCSSAQHVAARNKQLVARNLLPRNMLRWYKRGFSVLRLFSTTIQYLSVVHPRPIEWPWSLTSCPWYLTS